MQLEGPLGFHLALDRLTFAYRRPTVLTEGAFRTTAFELLFLVAFAAERATLRC